MLITLVRISLALIMLWLIVAPIRPAVAESGTVWYLKRDDAAGFNFPSGHAYDKVLSTDAPASTTARWYSLAKSEDAWWYTEFPATVDQSFVSGDWEIYFRTKLDSTSDKGKSVSITLMKLFDDGTTVFIADSSEIIPISSEGEHTVPISMTHSLDISVGERLALSFTWDDNATDELKIGCDSIARNSHLSSPPISSNVPVPEIPSLSLTALGMILLSSFTWWKSRKRSRGNSSEPLP